MSDSLPSFKEMAVNDIDNAFFNLDEFAEVLLVDGVEVVVVNDDYALAEYNSSLSEGLIECDLLYFAPMSVFPERLFVGKRILVRNQPYLIEKLNEVQGVYTILLAGANQ